MAYLADSLTGCHRDVSLSWGEVDSLIHMFIFLSEYRLGASPTTLGAHPSLLLSSFLSSYPFVFISSLPPGVMGMPVHYRIKKRVDLLVTSVIEKNHGHQRTLSAAAIIGM